MDYVAVLRGGPHEDRGGFAVSGDEVEQGKRIWFEPPLEVAVYEFKKEFCQTPKGPGVYADYVGQGVPLGD